MLVMEKIVKKMGAPSPQDNGTATAVRIIGCSFLCLLIVSSVIACAMWNVQQHTVSNSIMYYAGLFSAQLLNIGIVYLLFSGIKLQRPHYFQPFIISALLHLVVCITLSAIFFLYVVTRAVFYSTICDLAFFLVFAILTVYWSMAISVVREYRDYIIYDDFLHESLPNFV